MDDINNIEGDINVEKKKNLYIKENQSRTYEIPYTKDVYSFYIYIAISVISILLSLYFVISIFY